jgi:hypothetical protein
MRKVTVSILATAALAGGTLSGVALAANPSSHASADRIVSLDSKLPAKQREASKERTRHETSSRDRSHQVREHSEAARR